MDVVARLAARTSSGLIELNAALDMREASYGKADYEPAGALDTLVKGTYYLSYVDEQYRRTYAQA